MNHLQYTDQIVVINETKEWESKESLKIITRWAWDVVEQYYSYELYKKI